MVGGAVFQLRLTHYSPAVTVDGAPLYLGHCRQRKRYGMGEGPYALLTSTTVTVQRTGTTSALDHERIGHEIGVATRRRMHYPSVELNRPRSSCPAAE